MMLHLLGFLLSFAAVAPPPPVWRALQRGVEYAYLADSELHLVRIDTARAPLQAAMASAADKRARTAAEWCKKDGLAVAINLGMYGEDRLSNVGHAHAGGHVNNARWAAKYQSALAFQPARGGLSPALMVDLDAPAGKAALDGYGAVVQNLRLIRAPGVNVWSKEGRRWSEAAVAADKAGRVLFIFSRRPHSMPELNALLLDLPLGITAAMHVEGGPEASLSIHAGGVDVDLNGSYETSFNENDGERFQWPIPNVLGVRRAK
jgi:hypothetical protein